MRKSIFLLMFGIMFAGGVVGTTPMGPSDANLKCDNDSCDGWGYKNFEHADGRFDFLWCKQCGGPVGVSQSCIYCGAFNLVRRDEVETKKPCPKCEKCGECACCYPHRVGPFGGGHDFVKKQEPPTFPGRMA